MNEAGDRSAAGPRCIALVGPYQSGKTTLLEALLYRTGAIARQGTAAQKSMVGDASAEAGSHGMSVEMNVGTTEFLGERYSFLDCPGSIEFAQEQEAALAACDAAVVVCEPDEKKVPALQLILKQLDALGVPRFLFINKVDRAEGRIRDVLEVLQPASARPLVLRQIPIWQNGIVTGFVDLALERAFLYREHAQSEVIELPGDLGQRKLEARFHMLEQLADYDDDLMEQLLEEVEPPRDRVFEDLRRELREGLITPVLLGSAEKGNGIFRLLKALRHEAPGIAATAQRLGVASKGETVAQVMKTLHTAHGGKLSVSRILAGSLSDGDMVVGKAGRSERIAGLMVLNGQEMRKVGTAGAGDTVALGRLDSVGTGETLATGKVAPAQLGRVTRAAPVYGLAVSVSDRKDEVKLTAAITKLTEEDPSLALDHNAITHEMVLWGQGEMHLRVALERLAGKYGVAAQAQPRRIAYRETIRKAASVRGRHKKQSGGHGQFGDVVLDIKPLPRGEGFSFTDTITGGVVPKQYIPAVEAGVKDYLVRGPLGFPVVDIAVNLADGSYHTVDSSEMAFKTAARIGMTEGMAQCQPILLEPIVEVEVHVPSETTARVNQIVSGRRGQILGFDARAGWPGWDSVKAHMPEAELQTLIIELRSATAGVGTFGFRQDHMAELTGKAAEQARASVRAEAA
ncbi:elongation factor G [Rhodoligotrophos appendicifer]|uniref:elongation factor G n=1 Tax=Rhodoligotrophos appendicifer TaxID=987056 RepID=UPI001186BA0E|nr:elongation factor G [Rhodoligotrophos appendicifer]